MNIYTNSITNAINLIVSSWSVGVDSGWIVGHMTEYNTDANQTPWIGIYSPEIDFEPYRSNIIAPFNAIYQIPIITQVSNLRSPPDAIQELAILSGEVFSAVSCYRDLMNTVDIVKGVSIVPYNRNIEDEYSFMADQIIITAEVTA